MAEHATTEYATAEGNDYPAHEQAYRGFVTFTRWATVIAAAILVLMAIFLL